MHKCGRKWIMHVATFVTLLSKTRGTWATGGFQRHLKLTCPDRIWLHRVFEEIGGEISLQAMRRNVAFRDGCHVVQRKVGPLTNSTESLPIGCLDRAFQSSWESRRSSNEDQSPGRLAANAAQILRYFRFTFPPCVVLAVVAVDVATVGNMFNSLHGDPRSIHHLPNFEENHNNMFISNHEAEASSYVKKGHRCLAALPLLPAWSSPHTIPWAIWFECDTSGM